MMRLLKWFLDRPVQMAGIGVFLMVFDIFVKYILFPTAIYLFLTHRLYLYPGSEVWVWWKDLPLPIISSYYVFNVTNPDEIRDFGVKPQLQEVGSYVFSQNWEKFNITMNDDDKTVTYYDSRTFHFEPSLSEGKYNDMVTVINYPVVELAAVVSHLGDWKLSSQVFNMIMKSYRQDLFVTKTVREILFDGYHDLLLSHGQLFSSRQFLVDNKFSFMGMTNNTREGPITVRTGEDDIFNLAQITSFKGHKAWPDWNDTYCSTLNGSDGILFLPFLSRNDKLYVFAKELQRSIYLEYLEDTHYRGIDLYRFKLSKNVTANPRYNPENQCYCMESHGEQCLPSGLLDLYPSTGSHIFYSEPHFHSCDKNLLDGVEGLSPDREKHMSYIDIHPDLGYPVRARRASQFSFELKPYQNLKLFQHVPRVIFPMFWSAEEVVLTEELLLEIKIRFLLPKIVIDVFFWTTQLAGAIMTIAGVVLWKRSQECRKNNEKLLDKAQEPILNMKKSDESI